MRTAQTYRSGLFFATINSYIHSLIFFSMSFWPSWNEEKPFAIGLLALIGFSVIFLWFKTDYVLRQSARLDKPEPTEYTISVEGYAKVSGKPDIATITLGVETKADTVADAQKKNSETMNVIMAKVKALGIAEDDLQTQNYSVYENLIWNGDKQVNESKGWAVNQQLVVKVRDTSKISTVLETAGQNGITNIYGPNFTMDDPNKLKDTAREKAIADAMKKAAEMQKQLGVRFTDVVGYTEWTDSGSYPSYTYGYEKGGMGGGAAPDIAVGSVEVILHTSVIFRISE